MLHAPEYRTRYAENLKRDLPRIPFVAPEAVRAYVAAGRQLAHLHRDYATLAPYPLEACETPGGPWSWRVDDRRMRLVDERTALRYNASLTLAGLPPAAFDYRTAWATAARWTGSSTSTARTPTHAAASATTPTPPPASVPSSAWSAR